MGSTEWLSELAGTEVLLIRHGETEWNREQRVQGHHDVPLSERGMAQAERLAAWLAVRPPHAILTSDLTRCTATAEILAAGEIPVEPEPRIREARFGVFEGLSTAELRQQYPREYQLWRTDALRNRPPGGETLEELGARCMAALADHVPRHRGRTLAVVAHGGPVRVMVCGLLGLPLPIYPKLRVENTSVARILFTERGTILAGFNDVSHLRESAAAPGHAGWEER